MKKNPIQVFSEWVDNGKADGMEKNHYNSVKNMLEFALYSREDFTFIDAGCGTGWVVRLVSKMKNCFSSCGVDGSIKMINKARGVDTVNRYFCDNLISWKPNSKKDVVHSMEVLYYFKNPKDVLKNIYDNWLNTQGIFIMGIDFYFENHYSHDWPLKTNIDTMTLLGEIEWKKLFENVGFKNVRSWRVGKKKNWEGTLVVSGIKD